MDVTCPRCQTDYEFDDALVSERGTTVKCTNCGHQFRVFRPRAAQATATTNAPELWRIERREGEPLELRSLVELQRAIRAGRVARADLLRRGDGPPRRVGDIPELEPFFPAPRPDGAPNTLPLPTVDRAPPQQQRPAHTPAYGRPAAPPPPQASSGGTIRPPAGVPPPTQRSPMAETAVREAPDHRLHTPFGISPYNPADALPAPAVVPVIEQSGTRAAPLPPPRTPPPPPMSRDRGERVSLDDLAANVRASDEVEPPTARRLERRGEMDAPRPVAEPANDPYDSLFPPPAPKKRRGTTAIVVIVLLAAAGLAGATVGRPYVMKLAAMAGIGAPSTSASVGKPSERLERELAAGDRARSEGDYASAREAYVRATGIDEKSSGAWDGLCTAETELAMVHWVAALSTGSALERDQASSIGSSAGKSCARWAELARATDEGSKKASNDLRSVRALAAQGDGGGVRIFLGARPGDALLEALALLADATKKDAAAITAATKAAAVPLGKADLTTLGTPGDVALAAYTAAIAGPSTRLQDALAELGKRAPKHMLLDTLRQLGGGGAVATDAGPSDAGASDAVADAAHDAKAVGTGTVAVGEAPPSGDYRSLDEQAHKALAAGEVSKAETLFNAALGQHPGDIDALFGLGQIARSKGDHTGAISYFKQVLDASSGFSPARLALADEQWSTGQKDAAVANYNLYLDRVSEGTGADRARARTGKEVKKEDPPPP